MNNKILSIVIPMYNEELVINECYKRIKEVLDSLINMDYEIIFVNDGSKDDTLKLLNEITLNDRRAKVIDFSRNFGHQLAVTAGLYNSKGDAVVIIDSDLQDPPEIIIEMVKKWNEGFEVVYGKRNIRSGESKFKLLTAKYFYKFLSFMSNIDIPKDTGDFRLIDRKVVEAFKVMPERNRFIRGMISWVGFNQTYVEYNRDERFAGQTKYPFRKMIRFATDGIVSFSTKPLKIISLCGVGTMILSLILFVYVVISKLFYDTSLGWASLMVTILFLGGVQIFALGIIGEYIARIYDESKNRPLYLIKNKINFDKE